MANGLPPGIFDVLLGVGVTPGVEVAPVVGVAPGVEPGVGVVLGVFFISCPICWITAELHTAPGC